MLWSCVTAYSPTVPVESLVLAVPHAEAIGVLSSWIQGVPPQGVEAEVELVPVVVLKPEPDPDPDPAPALIPEAAAEPDPEAVPVFPHASVPVARTQDTAAATSGLAPMSNKKRLTSAWSARASLLTSQPAPEVKRALKFDTYLGSEDHIKMTTTSVENTKLRTMNHVNCVDKLKCSSANSCRGRYKQKKKKVDWAR